jgi:OTU domain-containing protein 6
MWLQVFSAAYPLVDMGSEFARDKQPPLQVCYLEHAYTSGQHYNSVVPLQLNVNES